MKGNFLLFFFLFYLLVTSVAVAAELQCPVTVATGTLYKKGSQTQVVNIFGFKRKPTLNSQTLVLPYPYGNAVKLKIVKSNVGIEGGIRRVDVQLEDASGTSLEEIKAVAERSPEYPTDVVVLWPLPVASSKIVPTPPKVLPPKVTPHIVIASIDLDGNGSADALLAEFCCETRKPSGNCDLVCSEQWQKINGKWILCDSSKPM